MALVQIAAGAEVHPKCNWSRNGHTQGRNWCLTSQSGLIKIPKHPNPCHSMEHCAAQECTKGTQIK